MDLFEAGQDDRRAGPSFQVNEHFAAKYDAKKRREELSKLQDKYGDYDLDDDEESTDYSSEDSEAEFVTPQVDAAILKVIGRIRSKDTKLYGEDGGNFFQEEEAHLAQALKTVNKDRKKKNEKPVRLKDFQRKALLATAGKGFKEDYEGEAQSFRTPAQEAEDLQKETRAAFLKSVDGEDESGTDEEEDEDDFLVRRDNASDSEDETDQYKRFLVDNVGQEELDKLLALRAEENAAEESNPAYEAPADDDFLRNYILNRGWLDKKSNKLPKYKEIVVDDDGPAPGPMASGSNALQLDHEDSDEELEKAEAFENKYNFRFEEAQGHEIQTHARDAGATLRRAATKRKELRDATKSRKSEEKRERLQELERLNELKKAELREKIAKIREVAGAADGFDLSTLDLEADYDPEEHNKKMDKVFDDMFYDDNAVDKNGKPVWDDDIDINDLIPDYNEEAYAPGGDAYDPTDGSGPSKKSRADRKKEKRDKKRNKGKDKARDQDDAALDEEELAALADPEERERKLNEYMEQYDEIGQEDVIGDLPTRFHYISNPMNMRGTADEDGLTPAEILLATDAELNEYESLKKIAPFRAAGKSNEGKRRRRLKELRRVLATRRWGEELPAEGTTAHQHTQKRKRVSDNADGESKDKKKRLGKKQRQKLKAQGGEGYTATSETPA